MVLKVLWGILNGSSMASLYCKYPFWNLCL